jgi:hypothetical protein
MRVAPHDCACVGRKALRRLSGRRSAFYFSSVLLLSVVLDFALGLFLSSLSFGTTET